MLNLLVIFHPAGSRLLNSELAEILHRPIRSLTFPEESTAGVSVKVAVNNKKLSIRAKEDSS